MEQTPEVEKLILALDASSTTVGYSIFSKKSKKLVEINYFHPTGENLLKKADSFEVWLKSLIDKYSNIDECVIEESVVAMFGGMSSAHTTTVLNQVNILYRYICYKFSLKVNTITVNEARKNCFPGVKIRTLAKMRKQKEKDFCFDLTLPTLKSYYTTKTISKGKNKGNVVYEEWCKDMADAYICGFGYLNRKQ